MNNDGVSSILLPTVSETPVLLIGEQEELAQRHSCPKTRDEEHQQQKRDTHQSDDSTGDERSDRVCDIPACIFVTEQEQVEEIVLPAVPRSPQQQEDPPLWQKRGRFLIWPAHLGDHFDCVLSSGTTQN